MLHDLRIGWRSLARSPLFFLTAAGSLALGIGACTVIFSVVYTLLLRPLPYPNPEQLVHVGMGNPAFSTAAVGGLAPDVLKRLRHDPNAGLSALSGFGYDYVNLTGVPTPSQLTVGLVTADYFRVYGVPARLGRTFVEGDCRAASDLTVVLSDHLWRTQFRAADEVVGQKITLGDKLRTVIGVMPPQFKDPNEGCELWLPLAEDGPDMSSSAVRRYEASGRLSDASASAQAKLRTVLTTLSANLAQTDPSNYKGWHLESHPLGSVLHSADTQRQLWLLLGAVGCVLLVTCANVANLQLVRAAARRREVGVRLALGASRARIMRSALTESLILATAGGGLGILASAWGVDAISALLPPGYSPWQEEIRLSLPVLGFSAGVAVVAGLLTGLLPAWAAARQDPAGSLAAGSGGRGMSVGPGGTRVRALLVVAEIALALVLLVGAGLMGRSLLAALQTDVGLRTERTLMLNLSLSTTRYPDGPHRTEFYRRILETVAAVPGVSGVGLTTTPPFTWAMDFKFLLPGQDANAPGAVAQSADYDAVNPAYFKTLGIPILQGRSFDERDNAGAPLVAVVNEAFARRYFPTGDWLGRRITSAASGSSLEIIGVVGNVRRDGLDQAAPAQAFVCYLQRPTYFATLYVRSAGGLGVESLTRPVEGAIWQLDADQPIGKVTTLVQAASGSIAFTRLYVALFGIFAALALTLAVMGIYGTIAYSVGQRTREIGIRLALGAQREDVLRLVLWQGTRLVVLGLGLGVLASLGITRLLTSLLYGVKATDPGTLAGVVVVLGGAAFLATYLPARRATRIDPLTALHEE